MNSTGGQPVTNTKSDSQTAAPRPMKTFESKHTNTTDDLLECPKCKERDSTAGFTIGDGKSDVLTDYIKAINYINSCHSIINEITRQKFSSASSSMTTLQMPEMPNFLALFKAFNLGDLDNFVNLRHGGHQELPTDIPSIYEGSEILECKGRYEDAVFKGTDFKDTAFKNQTFKNQAFKEQAFKDQAFKEQTFKDIIFKDKLFTDKLFSDKLFADKLLKDNRFKDNDFKDKETFEGDELGKEIFEGNEISKGIFDGNGLFEGRGYMTAEEFQETINFSLSQIPEPKELLLTDSENEFDALDNLGTQKHSDDVFLQNENVMSKSQSEKACPDNKKLNKRVKIKQALQGKGYGKEEQDVLRTHEALSQQDLDRYAKELLLTSTDNSGDSTPVSNKSVEIAKPKRYSMVKQLSKQMKQRPTPSKSSSPRSGSPAASVTGEKCSRRKISADMLNSFNIQPAKQSICRMECFGSQPQMNACYPISREKLSCKLRNPSPNNQRNYSSRISSSSQRNGSPINDQSVCSSEHNQRVASEQNQLVSLEYNQRVSSEYNQRVSSEHNQRVSSPNNQRVSSPNNQRVSSANNQRIPSINNQRVSSMNNQRISSINNQQVTTMNSRRVSSLNNRVVSPNNQRACSPNQRRSSSNSQRICEEVIEEIEYSNEDFLRKRSNDKHEIGRSLSGSATTGALIRSSNRGHNKKRALSPVKSSSSASQKPHVKQKDSTHSYAGATKGNPNVGLNVVRSKPHDFFTAPRNVQKMKNRVEPKLCAKLSDSIICSDREESDVINTDSDIDEEQYSGMPPGGFMPNQCLASKRRSEPILSSRLPASRTVTSSSLAALIAPDLIIGDNKALSKLKSSRSNDIKNKIFRQQRRNGMESEDDEKIIKFSPEGQPEVCAAVENLPNYYGMERGDQTDNVKKFLKHVANLTDNELLLNV